jgi:hypothetical protein
MVVGPGAAADWAGRTGTCGLVPGYLGARRIIIWPQSG